VTLLVEPSAGPARESLWMEMYLLTDEAALAALADRARAGCDVRVTLEPAPYKDEGANQAAFDRLASAGALVRWSSPRFSFTHAKAFTIDHSRLVVMTLNLTASGLRGNREFAVVDDASADVAAADAVFAGDFTGGTSGAGGRVVTSPDTSRETVAGLIQGASRRLTVETEELADTSVAGALVAARARGLDVTVVWPGPAAKAKPALRNLAQAGVTVRAVATPAIHAKALVADGARAYVGSANLSATSLDSNREVGLALADATTAGELEAVIAADAAGGQPLPGL
jgi:cardiolipin synthase